LSHGPDDLPPRVVDTRYAPRQRGLFAGRVCSRDGLMMFECRVRDLSETGARIVLKDGQCIPRHVFFSHSRTAVIYECEVSWTSPPQFGLKFLREVFADDEPGNAFLEGLRF
jgi:hypothetical protein